MKRFESKALAIAIHVMIASSQFVQSPDPFLVIRECPWLELQHFLDGNVLDRHQPTVVLRHFGKVPHKLVVDALHHRLKHRLKKFLREYFVIGMRNHKCNIRIFLFGHALLGLLEKCPRAFF